MVAHAGAQLQPHDLWRAWSLEPVSIALLVASAGLFVRGVGCVWRAAGMGRGVSKPNVWYFAAGWLTLALTLVSPLHALGGVLFSAHMAQHELLMTVAAPLLVLGRPLVPFVWALPPRWRRMSAAWASSPVFSTMWAALTKPVAAFLVHAIAIWGWHAPSVYDRAVTSELVHALQHASFLGTALLFWWAVLKRNSTRERSAISIGLLFATVLHTGALGAVLTLTSRLLYPVYGTTTAAWGLTPTADQQLGGLIMWVPGALPYIAAALLLFVRILHGSEQRAYHLDELRGPTRRLPIPPVRPELGHKRLI